MPDDITEDELVSILETDGEDHRGHEPVEVLTDPSSIDMFNVDVMDLWR